MKDINNAISSVLRKQFPQPQNLIFSWEFCIDHAPKHHDLVQNVYNRVTLGKIYGMT